MQWLNSLWHRLRAWFSPPQNALSVMQDLKREKSKPNPEWERLHRRFQALVFSASDRQRLWRREHRGADDAARLLSGITAPTPAELKRLRQLVAELESAR